MPDERMHDEHRGIRCDDGGREGRRRDVDKIRTDAEGAVSDERRRAGVRSPGDHEDAAVLTFVARSPRDRVEREFPGPIIVAIFVGMPMSATRVRPEFSAVIPSFTSWSVTVTVGRTGRSVPKPLGTSTLRIGLPEAFI